MTTVIERHEAIPSRLLGRNRDVVVHLPPGYRDLARPLAVLYLQDGQNLFDPATSFIPGQHWRLSETATRLQGDLAIEPLILVGIYNTGLDRIDEYTPTKDARHERGGQASLYGRFLVEELKPYIDRTYRTLQGPEHTGVGGSSLGALVSLVVALERPEVFGRVLAMSPSVWWDEEVVVRRVQGSRANPGQRIWIDIGTKEGDEAVAGASRLYAALRASGLRPGRDLTFRQAPGASHDERSWGDRVGDALRFLFPSWRRGRRLEHARLTARRLLGSV